jgi:hypothetical protein
MFSFLVIGDYMELIEWMRKFVGMMNTRDGLNEYK